jgi:hypothetical protein
LTPLRAKQQCEWQKEQARKELGDTYELVEIGETAKVDCLLRELEIEERLGGMIDKCLKRSLFLRGLKTIPTASSSSVPSAANSRAHASCVTARYVRP